ncbi:MAG: amidohydrolase family protein [Pseudomonadota bacterium]
MIIDAHTHTLCPAVNDRVAGTIAPDSVPYQRDMSPESKARDAEQKPELFAKFTGVARRLDDMKTMRIDRQVIAPAPGQQHYWAAPTLLAEISAMQNDHVADLVGEAPDRFVGLGTLPMTDTDASVAEIERATTTLGLRAFQIDSRVLERELSDRSLDPIYAKLEATGAGLMVHPLGFSHGERLTPFFMVNSVAQPLEELIAFNHLVMGGVLDRFPKLKVYIAHGGGFAPFYIGRFDHAWTVRPEVNALIPEPPSAYLRRLWYDTCVYRADHLDHLVQTVGADRVMLGSDYPFDMGDPDPLAIVEACDLPAGARHAITHDTAAAFFGL